MKTKAIRVLSLLLAVLVSVSMISIAAWSTDYSESTTSGSIYEKLDTNVLTDMGQEPEEISVTATAEYFGKEWYEYITYSENAVASYRLDDNSRLVYYDPYDYLTSMVMDVEYDNDIGWSTANSVTVSHTFSTTMSAEQSSSTQKSTSTQKADGKDVTHSEVKNSGTSTTEYNHSQKTGENQESVGLSIGNSDLSKWVVSIEGSFSYTRSDSTTTYSGKDEVTSNSSSETDGWTEVADRITKTTGSSTSTSNGWSQSESTSITRTFEAAYFNSDGSPLLWTVAHYEVKMPMKVVLQYKVNDRWVTVDTAFCLLTTLSGSCRAWQENGNTYFEHWATGEPVADSDFWSSFFTKDELLTAYQNKLYPD